MRFAHQISIFPKNASTDFDELCIKLCSHYTGSIFTLVRKSIRYTVNNARGNRTVPDLSGAKLFTSYRIGMSYIYLGLTKAAWPGVQKSDSEILFQKRRRCTEQPVHIRNGAFQSAIRYGKHHIWNRNVRCDNRPKNRARPVRSSVNRRPIRYGFRGATIIDPV